MYDKNFIKYMKILFNDREWVNLVKDQFKDLDSSLDWNPDNRWVCCNPFLEREPRKSPVIHRLAKLRNFLIEFDEGTLADQRRMIYQYHIPYGTIVFSGNKSLHIVICLNKTLTLDKYREYAQRIKLAIPCDPSCLEPARLTRVPYQDVTGERPQPMIAAGGRITEAELDKWLNDLGVTADRVKDKKRLQVRQEKDKGAQLTYKTMSYIAGQVAAAEAHSASLHAVKNLIEVGMEYEEIVKLLTEARQRGIPNESWEKSERATRRAVDWVFNFWPDQGDKDEQQ